MKQYLILVLCTINLLSNSIIAQNADLRFSHLNTDHGLSNSTITDIIQDSRGFIWVGTSAGLNRYNGYNFTVYKNIPNDTTSISSDRIESIMEDEYGGLWICTANGLNRFNYQLNSFERVSFSELTHSDQTVVYLSDIYYKNDIIWLTTFAYGLIKYNIKTNKYESIRHIPDNNNSLSTDNIYTLHYDSKDRIWLGNLETGVDVYETKTNTFKNFRFKTNDPLTNNIRCIFEVSESDFLFGTDNGIIRLFINETDTLYKYYKHNQKLTNSISGGNVWTIYRDTQGIIWVATQQGLNVFNEIEESFSHIRSNSSNEASISSDEVQCILQDNQGGIWFGTYQGGLNILNLNNQLFKHRTHNPNDPNSLSAHSVFAFEEISDNKLWLGIDHGGLSLFDKNKGSLKKYTQTSKTNSLPSNSVICLHTDKKNQLWVGMYAGGLCRFDKRTNTFIQYNPPEIHYKSLNTWDIIEDSEGKIWASTVGYGIFNYNPDTKKYTTFQTDLEDTLSLAHSVAWCLIEDKDQNIWVGNMAGLQKHNRKNNNFTYYPYKQQNTTIANTYNVLSVYEDSKDRFWVGIDGFGLNLFNKKTGNFIAFNENDGLINNSINSIIEDNNGNLWLSTNKGISRVTIENDSITNIYNINKKNGLLEDQFNIGAAYFSKFGDLYLGSTKGFVFFNPDSIRSNKFIPPVYITDFMLFNKPVPIDPTGKTDSPLKEHISTTDAITLNHEQSVFSLKFAALNFTSSENNQYAYILEGFENEWNYIGTKREVSYTNLDAGKYIFKVKASNNDGLWNQSPTMLQINILPPWWESWWFKTIVILIIVGSSITFYLLRMRQMKNRQHILESKIKERTKQIRNAKEKIEHSHKQITDSINYASKIQKAVLPSLKMIEAVFPEYFILYKPRDVVSGDFYWSKTYKNYIILIAADCTGHGVPGAFVSMLGISFLNEITQYSKVWESDKKASQILELLRNKVKVALRQQDEATNSRDGMDLALCIIDLDTKVMQFAGANNPLCIIRNAPINDSNVSIRKSETKGGFTISQIKADPMPIGVYSKERPFNNYEIQLQSNDKLYLFSDGFIDQFGGNEGKKFMTSNFRSLLLDIHSQTMDKQKETLEKTLKEWMGNNYKQIDDVLVMGIKI